MDKMEITARSIVERVEQLNLYNVRLAAGDKAKVRTTHDGVEFADRGQRVIVLGEMTTVTVQMEDGTIRCFDRDQLSFYATAKVAEAADK